MDMGFKGAPFTWSNRRKGADQIRERLDRVVTTMRWRRDYPKATFTHLPRYKSDHSPIIINCEDIWDAKPRILNRFRFEHMWLQHSNFENILKDSWTHNLAVSFGEQIGQCGSNLAQWARKEFGSVRKRKKELTEKLTELQQKYLNDRVSEEISRVEQELDQVLKQDETMWYQRSRSIWLKDGDKNSAFFHQKVSHRKKRNTIKKLIDETGREVMKHEEVEKMVRDYFI